MAEARTDAPIAHFVGGIPLPDGETVFRRLAETTGPYLRRLPEGETGIRKKPGSDFCRRCSPTTRRSRSPPRCHLSNSPSGTASFCVKFRACASNPARLQTLPRSRPVMPTWRSRRGSCSSDCSATASSRLGSNFRSRCRHQSRRLLPALTQHLIGEVGKIAAAMPNDRIALQWDVCQEVLAWEG